MSIKKVLVSLLFVVVFGIYVAYEQSNSNNSSPILGNKQSTPASSLAQSATTAQSLNQGQAPQNNTGSATGGGAVPIAVGKYRNGQYTGSSADAYYGLVQVKAIITGGEITDIQFLNYPQDNRSSLSRSNYALPQLKSEAIKSQSSNVNAISGATETSKAFIESLSSALSQAS
jgi:uncharacterized protein with FMN-binding domain